MSAGRSWLFNSRVAHYFRNGRSLCGRWMILGEPTGASNYPLCRACERALRKEGQEAGLR
jgi:hypothetical protein